MIKKYIQIAVLSSVLMIGVGVGHATPNRLDQELTVFIETNKYSNYSPYSQVIDFLNRGADPTARSASGLTSLSMLMDEAITNTKRKKDEARTKFLALIDQHKYPTPADFQHAVYTAGGFTGAKFPNFIELLKEMLNHNYPRNDLNKVVDEIEKNPNNKPYLDLDKTKQINDQYRRENLDLWYKFKDQYLLREKR